MISLVWRHIFEGEKIQKILFLARPVNSSNKKTSPKVISENSISSPVGTIFGNASPFYVKRRAQKKNLLHVSNQSVYLSLLKMGRYFRALLLCKFSLIFHGFFKPEKSDTFLKKTFFWKL